MRGAPGAGEILGGLAVKLTAGTWLVTGSDTDPEPARAEKVVNAYGEARDASNLRSAFRRCLRQVVPRGSAPEVETVS